MCSQIACPWRCKVTLVAFFDFSPVWVFKCSLKLLAQEDVYSHWLHLVVVLSPLRYFLPWSLSITSFNLMRLLVLLPPNWQKKGNMINEGSPEKQFFLSKFWWLCTFVLWKWYCRFSWTKPKMKSNDLLLPWILKLFQSDQLDSKWPVLVKSWHEN